MKIKQKVSLLLLTAVLAVCGVVAAVSAVATDGITWYGKEPASVYRYGETVTLPDRSVRYNGATAAATCVTRFPSGVALREKQIVLSEAGVYTVTYTAQADEKVLTTQSTFTVHRNAYDFSSDGSSAVYGDYTEYDCNSTGLQVRLAFGDTLRFTKLIDVADLTVNKQFLSGFITPDMRGSADFNKLTVRLTDSRDSSVYLQYELNRWQTNSAGKSYTYVSVGGNGQDMVGQENGKLYVNTNLGTPIHHSWIAQTNGKPNQNNWSGTAADYQPDLRPITLAFDYATGWAYAQGARIANVTDSTYYSTMWNGFPSGKARLTVSASGYLAQTANFCLTGVRGVDLGGMQFTDDVAPVITVQTDYTELPEAKLNVPYAVPAATAYDDYDGEVRVNTQVWYRHSDFNASVTMTNGAFVPTKEGTYTVEYTAADFFGNTERILYYVHAGGEIPQLTVSVAPPADREITLGYDTTVPEAVTAGGSGKARIEVVASCADTVLDISDSLTFRPEIAGEWTVTYTATDYVGNTATTSFTLEAQAGDKPILTEELYLPPVYVAGATYTLPALYADDYASGKSERKLCSVTVQPSVGATQNYTAGDTFVPVAAREKDSIRIDYVCEGVTLATRDVPVIQARDGYAVYVQRYFFGEGFTLTDKPGGNALSKGLLLTATQEGDVGWTFANAQLAETFSFEFTTAGISDFDALQIELADAEDASIAVRLTASVTADTTLLTCGGLSVSVAGSLQDARTVTVAYGDGAFTYNGFRVPVSVTTGGKEFSSFPSGKVYFSVTAVGARAGAGYRIDSVSGSIVTGNNEDYAAPNIKVLGDYDGSCVIGTNYTVAPAVAGDVLAPNVSLSVSVTDPDRNYVTDRNGLELRNVPADVAYVFTADKYGVYTVTYTASEENWVENIRRRSTTLTVIDSEAPVITLTSTYRAEAKVGDTIVMPDFTVSDNVTDAADITVYKYVTNAQGKLILLDSASNSVVCTQEGEYVFGIVAQDEFGNTSSVTVRVTVTK